MSAGLSDKLREIREKFVASLPERKERLIVLSGKLTTGQCTAEDMEDLRFIVHKIHGLAGTLGFAALGQNAAALELQVADAIQTGGYTSTMCDGVVQLIDFIQSAMET